LIEKQERESERSKSKPSQLRADDIAVADPTLTRMIVSPSSTSTQHISIRSILNPNERNVVHCFVHSFFLLRANFAISIDPIAAAFLLVFFPSSFACNARNFYREGYYYHHVNASKQ
jgi:hypothetical protein